MLINKILETAKNAAFEAGKIHMQYFEKDKEINFKLNEFDLVTNADKQSEQKILSIVQGKFPDHAILAEEGGVLGNENSDYLWIIDPLDGTTNYAHNFPQFAVSIAVYCDGKPLVGVIYDAVKKEMFFASKGQGAFLNEKPLKVSVVETLEKSLLATGFPYNREGAMEKNLEYFRHFLYKAQAIRRPGSAALDLAYVAASRLDGFWELNLSPWDVAAGSLIVEEAGGRVTNFYSEGFNYNEKNILASNGLIHLEMKQNILEIDEKNN